MLVVRHQLMHGCCWIVCPPGMQPETIISICTERFATAAADLDMLSALE